jgi:uroporphyrinogen-III decarboxylase
MNPRERYRETLLFGQPDKVPLEPGGPRESTLRAWHEQGLSEGVHYYDRLLEVLGIEGAETRSRVPLDVSFKMIPTFEEKVLEHRDGHYVVQDWMGAITEISDEYDYTYIRSAKDFVTRKWHRFPVQSREDWEERIKWRYDPDHSERFPSDLKARCEALRERDYPLSITVNGPFWQLREWVGMENLCIMMIDDPEFVVEMAEFWTDFVSMTLWRLAGQVELDNLRISEDMAYKAHSMISPRMVRQFLMPAYRRWVSQIHAAGCPIVDMDSDGNVELLIPLWIESGINVCDPIEVAAGNDIVAYRERYGRRMAYRGGIDKRAIAAGGEVMRDEVLRVVPPMLKEGGFIPSCDHGVPPDISWPNFVDYTRLLARLTGWL